jgi:hypothetical protein
VADESNRAGKQREVGCNERITFDQTLSGGCAIEITSPTERIKESSAMRLISTSRVGRANRITIMGTSV